MIHFQEIKHLMDIYNDNILTGLILGIHNLDFIKQVVINLHQFREWEEFPIICWFDELPLSKSFEIEFMYHHHVEKHRLFIKIRTYDMGGVISSYSDYINNDNLFDSFDIFLTKAAEYITSEIKRLFIEI